jgi:pyruvate carboxylase subunit B
MSRKIAMSKKITVTDTILRDAHQSLLATRMRTEDMLPICDKLDQVGYWSLEVWGGATFDACMRFLKEDPWERLRQLKAALPNTRLQMLLRGQNLLGYRHYSRRRGARLRGQGGVNGIDVFRIFDAMNDMRNLRVAVEAVKAAGKHAQGTICYTTSPVHTIEPSSNRRGEMEAMGCHSIAIKDMAGLLTPFTTGELVKALKGRRSLPVVPLARHRRPGRDVPAQGRGRRRSHRHGDLRWPGAPATGYRVDGGRAARQ